MKKVSLVVAALAFICLSFTTAPSDVNQKVLSAFNNTFKHANDVVWYEYTDFYQVRFINDKIDTRVKYDMQGNILETVRYYFGDELPSMIKSKLQNKYAGKSVFGVTEVTNDQELIYYIVMEDATHWITVKSDYFGNMSVYEKYKKA